MLDPDHYLVGMHAGWWIFWICVVALVALCIRGGRTPEARETPREVLRRRLASGEIAADEYQQNTALPNRDS